MAISSTTAMPRRRGSAPNLDELKAHIYGDAAWNIRGPDFNGILFINGEGDHWHELDGKGDNCWNAVNTLKGVDRPASICISWVDALRQACRRALIGWYAKPSSTQYPRSLDSLQQIAPRQNALLEMLDILSPSIYMWYEAYADGFDGAVARFRDKLAWIRDTYPHKLLCPTAGRNSISSAPRTLGVQTKIAPLGGTVINIGQRFRPTTARLARRPAPNLHSAGRSGTVCST
jgi:hypothetical protein